MRAGIRIWQEAGLRCWLPLIAFVIAMSLCAHHSRAAVFSEVRAEPKVVAETADRPVAVRFTLASAANVTLEVLDEAGILLLWRSDPSLLDAGRHQLSFPVHKLDGSGFKSGTFTYRLVAETADGERDIYDPAPRSWGVPVKIRDFSYDAETGSIAFTLPRSARVRIRIGLQDGPLLKSPLVWQAMPAGRHEIRWDGFDESGLMQVADHPDLYILINAYSLADNSLIIAGGNAAKATPAGARPGTLRRPVASVSALGKRRDVHALHSPWLRQPLSAGISVHGIEPDTDGAFTVERGFLPIRIEAPAGSRSRLEAARFEVVLFVDTVFLMEEEDGVFPFTYRLDTRAFQPGRYLLTVNLISYEDYVASNTLALEIR